MRQNSRRNSSCVVVHGASSWKSRDELFHFARRRMRGLAVARRHDRFDGEKCWSPGPRGPAASYVYVERRVCSFDLSSWGGVLAERMCGVVGGGGPVRGRKTTHRISRSCYASADHFPSRPLCGRAVADLGTGVCSLVGWRRTARWKKRDKIYSPHQRKRRSCSASVTHRHTSVV